MSYILDALKKSDQERQQGTSPHLYSIHSSAAPGRNFSPFYQRRWFWLLVGGLLLVLLCLGTFYFITRQNFTPPTPAPERTTRLEQPVEQATIKVAGSDAKQKELPTSKQAADKNDGFVPQVIIKENNVVLRSVAVKDTPLPPQDTPLPPPRIVPTAKAPSSVPLLQDLSADMQAAVPQLKYAGHTYSEDPAQRMIIINGQILREGDTVAADTHLSEITWEGVVLNFRGTRFLVKTN